MSLAESLAFRRDHPGHVLPNCWVERWKGTDEGSVKAEARLVILGFKDPHVRHLERSAPIPTNEALTAIMQYLASTESDA
eukprot:1365858-Karenia_brevis.AAC.1